MRISVAQIRPQPGEVQTNVAKHRLVIRLAAEQGSAMVVFPELSVTGYVPERAGDWAMKPNDDRFMPIADECASLGIQSVVGFPLKTESNPMICASVFQDRRAPPRLYCKQFLHQDENPFFSPGSVASPLIGTNPNLVIAICYELSTEEHESMISVLEPEVYVASVAKTEKGAFAAHARLGELAKRYSIPSLLSNCLGDMNGFHCGGRSAAWSHDGRLIAEIPDGSEGIIHLDTETEAVRTELLPNRS